MFSMSQRLRLVDRTDRIFLGGNFVDGFRPVRVTVPQNRSQASAIGSTEISDEIVDLLVRNFRRDAVHS